MALELWLVRHARPLVAEGVCYGRLDVPADPAHTGASAQALAQAWQAQGAQSAPALAWHSPAQRAQALAQAAADHGLPTARPDARLTEMDFGTWEGQRWDDIPRAALDAWTDDFHHHRPGGGDNVAGFLARVRDTLDDCARQARAQQVRRALWFTHAGVIRAVDVWLAQTAQPLQARDWPAKACEFGHWHIRVLKTSPSGLIIGTRWR